MNNQQAINLLKDLEKGLDDYCGLNDEGKTAFGMAITALELFGNSEQLPSIQPEYPKGRWIPTASEKGRHECSRCHEYAPCYQDGSEHLSTFCVLCGAKMEEGK